MRIKRTEQDMFGRTVPRAPASAKEPRASLRQRPIPPGLAPFIPVLGVVAVLIAIVVEPIAGVALAAVLIGAIGWVRYRDVKGVDYVTLRRRDPLYRSLDDFRHGRNRFDDPDR